MAWAMVLAVPSAIRAEEPFADWLSGAAGYQRALAQQRGSDEAVLVYFYTDWCPYCRRFNQNIVPSSELAEYLRHAIAVRVNSEAGHAEEALAAQFRVSGYPMIFVIPADGSPTEVAPFEDPAQFVAACEAVSGPPRAKKTPSANPVGEQRLLRLITQKAIPVETSSTTSATNIVHLPNGNALEGSVRRVNDEEIVLDVADVGSVTLRRADVAAIEGELPEAASQ